MTEILKMNQYSFLSSPPPTVLKEKNHNNYRYGVISPSPFMQAAGNPNKDPNQTRLASYILRNARTRFLHEIEPTFQANRRYRNSIAPNLNALPHRRTVAHEYTLEIFYLLLNTRESDRVEQLLRIPHIYDEYSRDPGFANCLIAQMKHVHTFFLVCSQARGKSFLRLIEKVRKSQAANEESLDRIINRIDTASGDRESIRQRDRFAERRGNLMNQSTSTDTATNGGADQRVDEFGAIHDLWRALNCLMSEIGTLTPITINAHTTEQPVLQTQELAVFEAIVTHAEAVAKKNMEKIGEMEGIVAMVPTEKVRRSKMRFLSVRRMNTSIRRGFRAKNGD